MIVTHNHDLPTLLAGMLSDPSGLIDITVTGISLDSRELQPGYVFLSLAKNEEQRIQYVKQASLIGVSVVLFDAEQGLTEQEKAILSEANIACYAIKKLDERTGEIAARFYGHPSLGLTVIAITGTNGKTSLSQFIAQGLESLGHACGVIGTLGIGRITELNYTAMTTPDPVTLQKTLAGFCQQGIKYAVIEASSHALDQGRLNSVAIDVAALTNISRDHLDYHQDMMAYSAAKSRLFDFSSIKTAVINSADSLGKDLISSLSERNDVVTLTYSSAENGRAIFKADNIRLMTEGIAFDLQTESGVNTLETSLLGYFNVDNLLATVACLVAVGISYDNALLAIAQCQSIDGRMQSYSGENKAQIVIDFAHTPDALIQALTSLQAHVPANGELWCVFGCGGDRDAGKRVEMGRAAEKLAANIVVTDDNPRSEDSDLIVNAILSGMTHPESVFIEHDRKLAITHAITHAKQIDIVLIAGKGHETFQEINGVKHAFSDRQVVVEALQAANDDNSDSVGEIA